MHRNFTFSGELNLSVDDEIYGKVPVKGENLSKVAIGIIEFLLSSVFFCFGVLLCEYASQTVEYEYENDLWPTVLFAVSWHLSNSISPKICEKPEGRSLTLFRCSVIFATIILFVGLLIPSDMICYSIIGGVCTNFISVQIRFVALEKLNVKTDIYEGQRQVARAASLFLMPYFMLLLVSYYDIHNSKAIFGSILLNIIPISLIIKYENTKSVVPGMSRYQTLVRPDTEQTELTLFSTPYVFTNTELDLMSNRSDSPEIEDEMECSEYELNSSDVQNYFRRAGVNILPEIPEEDEDIDINVINSKRLSKISMQLEEINKRDEILRKNSDIQVLDITDLIKIEQQAEKIDEIEYIPNFHENNRSFINELKSFNKIRSCCCTAYNKYVWSRRCRTIKYYFKDNIFYPLKISFGTFGFYLALLSKIFTISISSLYITVMPYIALKLKATTNNIIITSGDATFMLTYMAFSWCFFLVTLPLLFKLSVKRIRGICFTGYFITAVSLTALSQSWKPTNDHLTISCLLFGFGYGVLSYTEPIVFRNFVGVRTWKNIQGTLDMFAAIAIFIIYYFIYSYEVDLHLIFLCLLLFNMVLYPLLCILINCTNCCKKCINKKRNLDAVIENI